VKNKGYLIYALIVLTIVTVMSWVNLFDSGRSTGTSVFRSSYGSGGGSYGGSGGHK
jgi:uncharacterized membrane protein YgcG